MEGLLKKLHYKDGRSLILHAPEGYNLGIESDDNPIGTYDFIQLFVENRENTKNAFSSILPYLKENALIWVTYPKKSSKIKTDINRDVLREMIEEETDYRAVTLVAVDDTWSALRFRHKDKVKSKK